MTDTNSSDYVNVKLNDKNNSILVMGCAARLRNKLNNVLMLWLVKPGTVIDTLTSMANSNMDKLTAMIQQFLGLAPMMLTTTIFMMD